MKTPDRTREDVLILVLPKRLGADVRRVSGLCSQRRGLVLRRYGARGAPVPPLGCGVNTVDPAGMTGGTGGCAVFDGTTDGNAGAGGDD